MNETRERILDTAEVLFASRGISGTSLRRLTRDAAVNLAAVHYHFGSKEGLLEAVVERRARGVNAERLEALEKLFRPDHALPSIDAVLLAYLEPAVRLGLRLGEHAPHFARLVARIRAQPPEVVEPILRRHFGGVNALFLEALGRLLPDLAREELGARFRLAIGCMNHVFSGQFELDTTPGHAPRRAGVDELVDSLLHFVAAGLCAPSLRAHMPCASVSAAGGAA